MLQLDGKSQWHNLTVDETLRVLKTSKKGLSEQEAKERLSEFGLNDLVSKKRINALQIFLDQFKSFLIWILFFAMAFSYFIGNLIDAIVIAVIVVLNAVLGFVQEYRAERAMLALQKLTVSRAVVFRDGFETLIDAKQLVPGDVVVVKEGDKVPADCRVIESVNLKVKEAVLTGESTAVEKTVEKIEHSAVLAERKNMLFMNTTIVFGRGKAVVVETGMHTEFGKLASMIQEIPEEKTPLTVKLDNLGKSLGTFILGIIALLLLMEFLIGSLNVEMFLTAIALAVSAIPEGLPAVVTITLALGMRAMAKENAIVKKVAAVETLGSTAVICSDKTGTLTKNELTVREIFVNNRTIKVSGEGYSTLGGFFFNEVPLHRREFGKELNLLLKNAVLCNNASIGKTKEEIVGDPTEVALLIMGKKADYSKEDLEKRFYFLAELPFDAERKRMTSIYSFDRENFAFCKGSTESVLSVCNRISVNGKVFLLNNAVKEKILQKNNEMASHGLRVLGFAYRQNISTENFSIPIVENKMVFLGLVGMIDAPRDEAKNAVALCKQAGIDVKMVTGDHKLTAVAIAKEVGIMHEEKLVLTGLELDKMTDAELAEKIDNVAVFARVSPQHKLRIVKILKQKGKTVAVTGDGVNDAPALKLADIGVSMGLTGTDVSKEASDMIITDDDFSTIVKAVQQGRRVYSNIRNFVKYLVSVNFAEVIVIGIAILINKFWFYFPLPLLPIQILWINLVTDGIPALALGNEPLQKDEMKRPPRNPKAGVLEGTMPLITTTAVIAASVIIIGFLYGLPFGEEKARTIAVTVSIVFQMLFVFNCRAENKTFLEIPFFSNKSLVYAVTASIMLQTAVVYIPFLQPFFSFTALNLKDWAVITVLSLSALVVPYIVRFAARIAKETVKI